MVLYPAHYIETGFLVRGLGRGNHSHKSESVVWYLLLYMLCIQYTWYMYIVCAYNYNNTTVCVNTQ